MSAHSGSRPAAARRSFRTPQQSHVSLDRRLQPHLTSRRYCRPDTLAQAEQPAWKRQLADGSLRLLATLPAREERILRMRLGIRLATDHTLEEVGRDFNVTREHIRRIEAKALAKLRPSRSHALRSFHED